LRQIGDGLADFIFHALLGSGSGVISRVKLKNRKNANDFNGVRIQAPPPRLVSRCIFLFQVRPLLFVFLE
jgi:hypothetical protein